MRQGMQLRQQSPGRSILGSADLQAPCLVQSEPRRTIVLKQVPYSSNAPLRIARIAFAKSCHPPGQRGDTTVCNASKAQADLRCIPRGTRCLSFGVSFLGSDIGRVGKTFVIVLSR